MKINNLPKIIFVSGVTFGVITSVGCGRVFNSSPLDQSSLGSIDGGSTGGGGTPGGNTPPGGTTPPPTGGGGTPGGGTTFSTAVKFTCSSPGTRGIANQKIRRLLKTELKNSLEDLFGAAAITSGTAVNALNQIPNETPGDLVNEFQSLYSANHIEGISNLAEAVTDYVFANDTNKQRVFGTCVPQAINNTCVTNFLNSMGVNIFRHSIDATRQSQLLAIYTAGGGGENGLKALLMAILQAPEFLFHIERGNNTAAVAGRLRLDHFEVAARIAYSITGTTPDTTLMTAARNSQLGTVDQVRAQVTRLLQTARARNQLSSMVDSWLMTSTISDPHTVIAMNFGINAVGIKTEARQELLDYFNYQVLDANVGSKALFSSAIGFPKSARLAKVYGSAMASGNTPVSLPNGHRGLLLRASTLFSGNLGSSPIMRGVYVRKRLLCDVLASPDFATVDQRGKELGVADRTLYSNREIATTLTSPAACAACHTKINPIGFALEKFDSIGQPRTKEMVYNSSGAVIAQHDINTVVNDPNLEAGGPTALNDAIDLNEAISNGYKARACLAERLYSFGRVRPAGAEDYCAISEVEQALKNGLSVKEALIRSVANEDIFWRKDIGGN